MRTLIYPYIADSIIDLTTKKVIGSVYRPKISIRLAYGHRLAQFTVDCLIDSGSDTNVFPAQWGEAVGIKILKGVRKTIGGIGNVKIEAYTHKVKLYMGSDNITVDVDFSPQQQLPLLGRVGFFDQFSNIKFFEKQRKIELSY